MRFLADGADIPHPLLHAVNDGKATFLCGAGVSAQAGMPLFKKLTKLIYKELNEKRENEEAEQWAFERKEYDRALRSLEKRTNRPETPKSHVREAVTKLLQVPRSERLGAHKSLLQASKDKEGRTRLLTTNFDTLFERAAKRAGLSDVPSHAGKVLPKPGSRDDHGILHLHGRIADEGLGLEETDLVLTSADFGDAYLRDGWAARYIEDRMRTGTLVLIGYGAEDAAFRLLLEALDADRDRFPDLEHIYAITKAGSGSASLWRAKGVIPVEFKCHEAIYQTMKEWADYKNDREKYTNKRLKSIFSKPPDSISVFEKEQLEFFLESKDVATAFVKINPPITWLRTFVSRETAKLDDRQVGLWIERNLAKAQTVREVVASIDQLGAGTTEFLIRRILRLTGTLSPVLKKSWWLIVQHLRDVRYNFPRSTWYDLKPRIESGERSPEVLEGLVHLLRPRLSVEPYPPSEDEPRGPTTKPADLMRIEYTIGGNIPEGEILETWSPDAPAEEDEHLLKQLVSALDATLAGATWVGLENEKMSNRSDFDVSSVAADTPLNEHRSGMKEVVRVIAGLWTRLSQKNPDRALKFLDCWRRSRFRLVRRLALYAGADPCVHPDVVAAILTGIPQGDLFSAPVEVHRLLKARWNELPSKRRVSIERRLCKGPPRSQYPKGIERERKIDRARFDILKLMEQDNLQLSASTKAVLNGIQQRWPLWIARSTSERGLHIWSIPKGDPKKFRNVPDDRLVAEARRMKASAGFGAGDHWQALCMTNPGRALQGLEAEVQAGRWPGEHLRPLLLKHLQGEPAMSGRLARLLIGCADDDFAGVTALVSEWLEKHHTAVDEVELWALWDKVHAAAQSEPDNIDDTEDILHRAINSPAGHLAQILVCRLDGQKSGGGLPPDLRQRMDSIVAAPGSFGRLARAILASSVASIFDQDPDWTKERLLPLFEWSSPEASDMWSARSFANDIGSPELVDLTIRPLLAVFGRAGTPIEQLQAYAGWLTIFGLANKSSEAGYPIDMPEIRAALRKAGPRVLSNVAHILSEEMEETEPNEKLKRWRDVVGPVFEGIWPLDVELQTPELTFKLVQILRTTGKAFPEAADMITPFIRPDCPEESSTISTISEADGILFTSSPDKMLRLVSAVVGPSPPNSVPFLNKALDRLLAVDERLADNPEFRRLRRCAMS